MFTSDKLWFGFVFKFALVDDRYESKLVFKFALNGGIHVLWMLFFYVIMYAWFHYFCVILICINRLWLNQRSEAAVPWLSMTVYGHPDSLISWGTTEHTYRTNGDNLYSLIILRDQLRIYKVSGSRKPQRMYVKSNNNK